MDNSVGNLVGLPGNAVSGLEAEPAKSHLRVEIVPIVRESDRLLYNMALGTLWRMIERIVREMRGEAPEKIEEEMGL